MASLIIIIIIGSAASSSSASSLSYSYSTASSSNQHPTLSKVPDIYNMWALMSSKSRRCCWHSLLDRWLHFEQSLETMWPWWMFKVCAPGKYSQTSFQNRHQTIKANWKKFWSLNIMFVPFLCHESLQVLIRQHYGVPNHLLHLLILHSSIVKLM